MWIVAFLGMTQNLCIWLHKKVFQNFAQSSLHVNWEICFYFYSFFTTFIQTNSNVFFWRSAGHVEIIKLLLDHGAEVDARTKRRETALHYAAVYGNALENFKFCSSMKPLRCGYQWLNSKRLDRKSYFFAKKSFELFIVQCSVWILFTQMAMKTLSGLTFGTVWIKLVLNSIGSFISKIPKFWSISGHADAVKLLLEHGADVNAKNGKSKTPLQYTSYNGFIDAAKILIQHGADVNSKTRFNVRPLSTAATNGM